MDKKDLKQKSEFIINSIKKVTGIDLTLNRVDCYLRFNDTDEIENHDEFNFLYNGNCKSHSIRIMYFSNDDSMKYRLWYKKIGNRIGRSKEFSELFDTELELCVFLKQSKFKTK
jgi:hypothetical protein